MTPYSTFSDKPFLELFCSFRPNSIPCIPECNVSFVSRIISFRNCNKRMHPNRFNCAMWLDSNGFLQAPYEIIDQGPLFTVRPVEAAVVSRSWSPLNMHCLVPSRSSSIRASRAHEERWEGEGPSTRTRAQLSRVALQEPEKKRLEEAEKCSQQV